MAPAASDPKLDLILDQLKALGPIQSALEDLRSSVGTIKEEVKSLRFEIDTHGDRLNILEKEMLDLKSISNSQQQHLRSLTLRILNLPVVPGEADDNHAGLRSRVYDTILKPLLTAAKSAKDISSIPQMSTIIEACFRPFNAAASSNSNPPHVIVKLSSRPIKIALLKNRKHLPRASSDDKSAKIYLVEDLTLHTHQLLVSISRHKDVAKAWTVDGSVKFIMVGKSTVNTVKSAFEPIEKILAKCR